MKINYNVTGSERKSLVAAISQELNNPSKYLGAPTFAYEVGGYHIDKTGTLTGEDNSGLIADLCGLHSFKAVTEEYDSPTAEPADATDPYPSGSMDSWYAPGRVETDRLTIEYPLDGFTPEKLDNIFNMVNAKAPLLKASLGTDELPIKQTIDTLLFPWFSGNLDEEHTKAYSALVSLLCKTAKEKKRVTAKEKDSGDNPKYAMRCFLLSLGFIGDEYKTARKILLSNLDGNSSWGSNEAYTAMQEQRRNAAKE